MTMLNGEPIETPNISTAPVPPPVPPPAPAYSSTDDSIVRILGIVSLVLAFVFPLGGIVVGAIGLSRARTTGQSRGLNLVGLVLSIVMTVVILIATIVIIVLSITLFTNVFEVCQQLGSGTHEYNGVTYECNT